MRTALRRNALIAAGAFGLVMVVVLVAERRDVARAPPTEEQAKHAAVQPRMPEEAANGSSALPSPPVHIAAPAARADSTATKPVIINAVTPWLEIARMPQYVKADYAERRAIRDLYWAVCVEAKIPLEQRTSAYWQFVRTWDISESGASDSPTRTTSAQYLREQQPGAPSPVTAETMGKWCKR